MDGARIIKGAGSPFSSEILLQQALAGLLARMPDVSGVQILQGSQEYGKDLVFYARGGFGEQLFCACVVKNSKITGEVDSSSGARTILFQAQQALDTPHYDGAGKEVRVERVYIITPFDLPPATVQSVLGQLRERSGQVLFIGGAVLFDLFKRHWPDFFADEAVALEQHLSTLSQSLEKNNPIFQVASLYNLGAVEKSSARIHVQQAFHRELTELRVADPVGKYLSDRWRISEGWTKQDLKRARADLRQLMNGVRLVAEWGYYDQNAAGIESERIVAELVDLDGAFESAWGEALRKEYAKHQKAIPKVGPDARVNLVGRGKLLEAIHQAEVSINLALLGLDKAERAFAALIDSHAEGSRLLADPHFLALSVLNDFANVAPEGFLTAKGRTRWSFSSKILQDWQGPLLVVGAPGYGKSSFCRWNALNDAEAFSKGQSGILPVYVPLHQLAYGQLGTFEEVFRSTAKQSALLTQSADDEPHSIRLYLDGLDEIPSEARRRDVIHLAQQGMTQYPGLQVIVTARDYVHGSWLNWLPRLSLSHFEDEQVYEFILKWLDGKRSEVDIFYSQLSRTPSLTGLLKVPLLATLIILIFRRTGRLPENKPRLYELFIDLLSEGWDLARGILRGSKYGPAIKRMILRHIAGRIHLESRRQFGEKDIKDAMRATLSTSPLSEWEGLRDELLQDGLISSGVSLEFSHFSFQEFLAAKDFMGDPRLSRVKKVVQLFLAGDNWWRELIAFYIALCGNPREVTHWVLAEVDRAYDVIQRRIEREDPTVNEFDARRILQQQTQILIAAIKEAFPEFPIHTYLPERFH